MSILTHEIGFSSQRLRYEWVRHAASLGAVGVVEKDMVSELNQYLDEKLSTAGTGGRGSREKVITILRRIWAADAKELRPLRHDGFGLLRSLPEKKHLAVHWGMTMAAYPYWSDTAACVGRLLRLQDSASSGQIQRRMQEIYGEREVVARATRNVVRSFISWNVLLEGSSRGVYTIGPMQSIEDSQLIAWLVEASLIARRTGSAPLKDIIDGPSLFPFRIPAIRAEHLVEASSRLDMLRHGLDQDLIVLRNPSK